VLVQKLGLVKLRDAIMPSPRQDILKIIENCHAAVAVPKKSRPDLDAQTIEAARKILERLKDYDEIDGVLMTIKLKDGRLGWWELMCAMEAAEKYIERRLGRKRK
jgi:hypothetical protein